MISLFWGVNRASATFPSPGRDEDDAECIFPLHSVSGREAITRHTAHEDGDKWETL